MYYHIYHSNYGHKSLWMTSCTFSWPFVLNTFTFTTGVRPHITMHQLMWHQVFLSMECFIAHVTGIWSLLTMDKLVSFQNAQTSECLTAHITGIQPFITVYELISFQTTHICDLLQISQGIWKIWVDIHSEDTDKKRKQTKKLEQILTEKRMGLKEWHEFCQ